MRIIGDHIMLRTVEKQDLDVLFKWENDPATQMFNTDKRSFSKKEISEFIESIHDIYVNGQLRLMMIKIGTNDQIGTVDLFEYDKVNLVVGIGVLVFEDKNRNNGYATEAVTNTLRYAAKHLNIKKLYCNIDPTNVRSASFFKSIGFRKNNQLSMTNHQSKQLEGMDFYMLELTGRL